MGGGGDWFHPGISPFQFLNEKPRNFYGSQTGAQWPFWQDADSSFTRKPVYTPDASSRRGNRAFAGGEGYRRWNETRSSNTGSMRKPGVTSIHVQDGNAEYPESGNVVGRRSCLPPDLEGVNVARSLENLKKVVPAIVSQTSAASDGASGAMSMRDNAAATLIQSHFRGFMVRLTAPLNSLRVIASVMSQLRKLKAKISTDEYMDELRADSKNPLKLSETIMSLLLRLDALQGVHSTVREIRKAAVREAVALQEAVDSVVLKHGILENLQKLKALPTVGCNCLVNNGSDTEKHLEAAPVTNSVSGTVFESIEGRIASNVPVNISQSLVEEYESSHLGESTNHCMTSDEILKIHERDSEYDHSGTALTPLHTTEDHTSVAIECPRLTLGDNAMEHEDAEISCKDVASGSAVMERGTDCSDQNMEENGSASEKNCARKVGVTVGEDLQRSTCHENLRSTLSFDYENYDQCRNDAEEAEQHSDDVDRKPRFQDFLSQERSSDANACSTIAAADGSCAEADSDALNLLQNANKELKLMLKRCQMTNDLQTALICDLKERLLLLERRVEEKSKSSPKSSSKSKKKSSSRGRFSERRSNRNRNGSSKHWHHYWLEDENCDVEAARDDRKYF